MRNAPAARGSLLLILLCFLTGICAVPLCTLTEFTTECSVRYQSDFGALPTNVTKMDVFFTEDHSVTIGPGVFPVRPNLVELTIDLNHIRNDIQPGAFILLESLTSLTFRDSDQYRPLRSKRLRAGVFSGLSSVTRLELEEMGIFQVDHGVFHNLPELKTLNLHHNMITSLPAKSFTNTTKLETLVLSRNKLTSINDNTFQDMNRLVTLDLSSNSITTLGPLSFGNLPHLEKLVLKQNSLVDIGMGTFQSLPSLKTLNLQSNHLEIVKSDTFRELPILQNLDISGNQLKHIEDLAFNDLINLEFLEIYDNNLNMFTSQTFKGLSKLIYLDAYINNLTELNDDIFSEMNELGSLHLHQANIHRISVGAFNGLNRLSILTLQQNNLTTLPEGVLDVFEQLAFLDISGNPWNCTCAITWLHPWSDGHYLGTEMNTTCAGLPEPLLQYTRDNYYICRRTTTSTTTTTTTQATTTKAPTTEATTSASLIILTSSVDPGYKTTLNASASTDTSVLSPVLKIVIGVAVGVGVLLILLIIILACYCRKKKYAFWKPPRVQQPPIPRTPEKEDKSWLTYYSPSKDPETGTFGNGVAVKGPNDQNGFAPATKSYDNHGLHVDDVTNANHKAMQGKGQEHPAVVAHRENDPVNDVLHSYSHSVSDAGTHHIDNNLPLSSDDVHLNDLNQRVSNDSKRDKKKEKKSKGKKHKTSNVSSSDNENPYRDVYGAPTIAMSDMADNSPRDGYPEHNAHDAYEENPPYNPGYTQHDHRDEFPMY